jgi:hypothetical protein
LKAPGFNPRNLESDLLVSNFAACNSTRNATQRQAGVACAERGEVLGRIRRRQRVVLRGALAAASEAQDVTAELGARAGGYLAAAEAADAAAVAANACAAEAEAEAAALRGENARLAAAAADAAVAAADSERRLNAASFEHVELQLARHKVSVSDHMHTRIKQAHEEAHADYAAEAEACTGTLEHMTLKEEAAAAAVAARVAEAAEVSEAGTQTTGVGTKKKSSSSSSSSSAVNNKTTTTKRSTTGGTGGTKRVK